METGSADDGSGDALQGLAFGKKVYFEDGGGGSGKAAPAAKRGKTAAGQQPAARCQVEGCKADLAGVKAYYWRHKVCGAHSKAPKVIVAGLEQRFCQQCSRFHQLPEFDQGKRSCRRRLAGHNERRRKPPQVPIAPHYGRFASSHREDSSRFRSSLMDFTYPAPLGTISGNVWPTVRASERVPSSHWQGGFEVPTGGILVRCPHSSMHAVMGGSLFNAPPPNESLTGASDSCCALSLLSNEPWSSATRNEARTILRSANSEGAPVAQPVIAANYMTNSWGFRCHGVGSSSNEIQHELARAGRVTEADRGEFADELELALQGGRQGQNISPGRPCSRFGDVMHWSL